MSTIEITALDGLKFELQDESRKGARIKVIGVGGAGANAVARMLQEGLDGVEFHVLNTDLQSLASSNVPSKMQIGAKMTKGLGVGSDPLSRASSRSGRYRANLRAAAWRGYGVRHRGPGRRHGRGRGTSGRFAGQRNGCAHGGGGNQAVQLRRAEAHEGGGEEHGRTGGNGGHSDHHTERPPARPFCRAAPA